MKNRVDCSKHLVNNSTSYAKLNKTNSYLFNTNQSPKQVGGGINSGISTRLYPYNKARSTSPLDFTLKRQIVNEYLTTNVISENDISQYDKYSKRQNIVKYRSVNINRDVTPTKNESITTILRDQQKKFADSEPKRYETLKQTSSDSKQYNPLQQRYSEKTMEYIIENNNKPIDKKNNTTIKYNEKPGDFDVESYNGNNTKNNGTLKYSTNLKHNEKNKTFTVRENSNENVPKYKTGNKISYAYNTYVQPKLATQTYTKSKENRMIPDTAKVISPKQIMKVVSSTTNSKRNPLQENLFKKDNYHIDSKYSTVRTRRQKNSINSANAVSFTRQKKSVVENVKDTKI